MCRVFTAGGNVRRSTCSLCRLTLVAIVLTFWRKCASSLLERGASRMTFGNVRTVRSEPVRRAAVYFLHEVLDLVSNLSLLEKSFALSLSRERLPFEPLRSTFGDDGGFRARNENADVHGILGVLVVQRRVVHFLTVVSMDQLRRHCERRAST